MFPVLLSLKETIWSAAAGLTVPTAAVAVVKEGEAKSAIEALAKSQ